MASASSSMRPSPTIDTDDMGKEESLPTGCPGQYVLGSRGKKTPKATATTRASALAAGGKVIAVQRVSNSNVMRRSNSKDSCNSMGSRGRADGAGRSRNRFSFGNQLAAPGPTSPSAAASFSSPCPSPSGGPTRARSPCPSPSGGPTRARSRSQSEERMDGIQKKFQDQVQRSKDALPIAGPSPSKRSTSQPASRESSPAGAKMLSRERPRGRPPRSPDRSPKLEGKRHDAKTFFDEAFSHLTDEEDKKKERIMKEFFRSPQDLDQEFEQIFTKNQDSTELGIRSESPAGEEEMMSLVQKAREDREARDQKDKTAATSSGSAIERLDADGKSTVLQKDPTQSQNTLLSAEKGMTQGDSFGSIGIGEEKNDPLQAARAQRRSEQSNRSPAQAIANRRHSMGDVMKRVWGKIAVARNIQTCPTNVGLKPLGSQVGVIPGEETADSAKNASNEEQPLQPSMTLPGRVFHAAA